MPSVVRFSEQPTFLRNDLMQAIVCFFRLRVTNVVHPRPEPKMVAKNQIVSERLQKTSQTLGDTYES